jgi:hypothetical protein
MAFQEGVTPPNYPGARDTVLWEEWPTSVSGGASNLSASGNWPAGSGKDAAMLLQWDITEVPADAFVLRATITVTVFDGSPQTYNVVGLRHAWTESATWNEASPGVAWAAPGARGAGDRHGTGRSTMTGSSTGSYSFELDHMLAQKWVTDPSKNHGVIIENANNGNRLQVRSSDYWAEWARPKLTIQWTQDPSEADAAVPPGS